MIVVECDIDEAITEMLPNLHRAGLTMAEKRNNARWPIAEFGYTVAGVADAIGAHPTPGRAHLAAGSARVHIPCLGPTELHTLLTRWRGEVADGRARAALRRAA